MKRFVTAFLVVLPVAAALPPGVARAADANVLIAVTADEARSGAAEAQQTVAPETPPLRIIPGNVADLDAFKWIARPVVVFADTPADPRFGEQMDLIAERPGELSDRDVVVITDTDPAHMSAVRRRLRPRGFMLAIIAKDGTVNLRKPFPWDVREISRAIDKMPMRQEELHPR